MGIDSWVSEDDSEEERDSDNFHDDDTKEPEKQVQSTKEFIGLNIKQRSKQTNFDIGIEDGELKGPIEDIAMLFAVMTMDFSEADFDELINDESQQQ